MKIWVDDVRPAPNDTEYIHIKTVGGVIFTVLLYERKGIPIELIDLDHDAGDFAYDGDYIEILEWLERTGKDYPIRIHSMNPVGVENMRRIIRKNGWVEIK